MNTELNIFEEPMLGLYTFLLKFLGVLLVFLAPVQSVMFAVGFLVMADFITGVLAARKRKEKITSYGFRSTTIKMLAYQGTVLTAFVVESFLLSEVPMVKVVSTMIALTEIKSFFENIEYITGVNFWDETLKKLKGTKLPESKKGK